MSGATAPRGLVVMTALLVLLGAGLTACQSAPVLPVSPTATAAQQAEGRRLKAEAEKKYDNERQAKVLAKRQREIAHQRLEIQKQRQRERLINKFQSAGILGELEGGAVPKLWVPPGFHELTFKEKQTMVGLVAAYAWGDPPRDGLGLVVLKDALSGKKVGSFSIHAGLKME